MTPAHELEAEAERLRAVIAGIVVARDREDAWPIRRADGLTPAQVRPFYRPAVRRLQPMPEQRDIFEGLFARLLGRGK